MPTIATWNVNSIKARLPNVLDWLGSASPDIALLQEIKCEASGFPREAVEDLGYNVSIAGQKSYNGVAFLSKRPHEVILDALPGDEEDDQARYLEAEVDDLRVACLYLPNGNPVDSPKYPYKLAWMSRLRDRIAELLQTEQAFALGGDYNVIPAAEDCYDPAAWADDALYRLETRRAFRAMLNLGMVEAYRALHSGGGAFSFWDYQRRAWDLDNGIRIDHFLLSPQAADRLEACTIDREPRAKNKASDHTPVVVTLREQ